MSKASDKKTAGPVHLVAGGVAGLCEALACHPLDTIKVRMQLSTRARLPGVRLPVTQIVSNRSGQKARLLYRRKRYR
jgi:hypothetical protein